MDEITLWRQKIQTARAEEVQIVSCEDADAEATLKAIVGGELPVPIATFLHFWKQQGFDSYQVLVQSAATVHPEVMEELGEKTPLAPLRSFLLRTEQAAILCLPPTSWRNSWQWGYFLQIRSLQAGGEPAHLVLRPPVSTQDIQTAEAVLRLRLPPTFKRFLMLTNGLGIDAKERPLIYGAGPLRADWKAVQLGEWLVCEQFPEIAAMWRSFQGIYDYERIMDWENGENTFGSDETLLVPFGYTYETWCFDRSRIDEQREYPVLFWDHETRTASDSYLNFADWFAGEIESYLFSE